MGGFAWVTLATNDSYSLGALVLAHSLKQVGTRQQLVVLVTPGVTNSMKQKLQSVFDLVQEVNILDSKDETNLKLLKRPELGVTFTKLHCWRLTQFDKCVFLDADTLVLQNCDELFEREELSAAPDVGWPDCFNSGVFVYKPSTETYEKLIQLALEKGSFDGGDQGLLNMFFADWATKDISKHLPFIYNLCSTACYSYLPAFKQFGANAKIIHFIGSSKPWLQYFNTETRKVQPSPEVKHLEVVLQRWWDIFCNLIHSSLTPDMAGLAGAFAQLTLGAPRTAEQSALDDHLRRQGWEVGNIDYLGRDSFDNIWSKICETLQTAVAAAEPPKPKEPTPPASEVKPSEKTALEAPQETPKPTSEVPTPASPVPQQQQQQQPEPEVPQQCPLKAAETPQTEPSICPLPPKTQETVPEPTTTTPALQQQPPSPQPIQEQPAVPQSPKPAEPATPTEPVPPESPKAAEPALKPATPTQETVPPVAPKEPVPPESPKAAEPAPACPLKPATPTQETAPLVAPKEPVPAESPKAAEPALKPATPTQEAAPPVAPKEPAPPESPKAAEPVPTCPAKPATPKEPVPPESPKAAEPAPTCPIKPATPTQVPSSPQPEPAPAVCPIKPATPTQETAPVPPAPQPPVPESPKPTPGKGEPEPAKQEQASEPGTGGASSVASPTPPPRKGSGGGKKASKSKK